MAPTTVATATHRDLRTASTMLRSPIPGSAGLGQARPGEPCKGAEQKPCQTRFPLNSGAAPRRPRQGDRLIQVDEAAAKPSKFRFLRCTSQQSALSTAPTAMLRVTLLAC